MLKLNVGFNRKIGEPGYASRGASINLALELDSGFDQPDRLRERIRQLFGLARQSVEEELAGNPAAAANGRSANGNGHTNGRQRDNTRRATASQVRALHAIAERHGINLAALLSDRYSLMDSAALSITEASQLIDELKGHANGNGSGGRR